MIEYFDLMREPGMGFLLNALWIGILASAAFGVTGTFVVVKKISYSAGAVSHAMLAGIGAALFMQSKGIVWLHPLMGACAAAILAALLIGMIHQVSGQREDTAIGIVWAVGMAVGLLFIARTSGYVDPMNYLFGNILLVSRADVWRVAGLDGAVLLVAALFYRKFLAVCFDRRYAEIRGVPVLLYYYMLLLLIALTTVLLVNVVGIVMVIALLTLPAATANLFANKLWLVMVLASVCCLVSNVAGLVISFRFDFPSGPVIILVATVLFMLCGLLRLIFNAFRTAAKSSR